MIHRLVAVAVLLSTVALGGACANRVSIPPVDSETRMAIAACTGGLSTDAQAELAVVVYRRNGSLISSENAALTGGQIFRIGEVTGDTAVQLYNQYVTCLNDRQRAVTGIGDAPVPVRRHHALGALPSGEAVVQSPLPQETGYNAEIQLQIVASGSTWASEGEPYWDGDRESPVSLQPIGSRNSFTFRFVPELAPAWLPRRQAGECSITLYAIVPGRGRDGVQNTTGTFSVYWQRTFHIRLKPSP